jgi:hypothetical protein
MSVRVSVVLLTLAAAFLIAAPAAEAQWWQRHPGYLHAMSDLRSAYWQIQHRDADDGEVYREERAAMSEIRAAYQELKDASIIDDKDIDDQPPADFGFGDHKGRLGTALNLLHRARLDISGEETDSYARGWRNHALNHITNAVHHLQYAMNYWRY